ncbi:efflux transporter outer membrane subunit [Sphingomonas sp. 1P06PA]|uniref:efflux transporter outer membrane subunit n=1 Tax=Sphingomonas sp. 1P06PA TaxID=554121 RepID=UPI0039A41E3B
MTRIATSTTTGMLALALLAGCTVGPNYRPPTNAALKVPDSFLAAQAQPIAGEVDLARWWQAFQDPVLVQLVDRALAANLDIEAAGARLRQARASLRGTRGQLFPTLGASGSVARSIGADGRTVIDPTTGQTISTGGDTTIYRAGLDASYEVDLFGGIRRSIEAARADADASQAALRSTQLTIASEIAFNYLDARLGQTRLRIARDNLRAQDETVQIVGWRVQAGLVSSLDLEQARQLRAQTAASIPSLESGLNASLNRIAVLLGEAPGAVNALMATEAVIPLAPAASDVPAAVIQRRPDVAQAERQLAAETARIGVQTAQLYPALRLSGTFSGSDTSVGDLLSSALGNIVGAISAPIFQGGQIRAAIEGQRASTDASFAAYRQTVLVALEEVENALVALSAAERRERELVVAEEASRNAVTFARSQYRAGLIDFQSLLESERSLLSAQDSRASVRAERATATVQLYKALGGGWQSAPEPRTVTTSSRAN